MEGMSLYVRRLRKSKHGSPAKFAKRCADHGLRWVAVGGPWHDDAGERFINRPSVVRRYSDALRAKGIQPFVWGYPAADRPELFVEEILKCRPANVLADPELAMNPSRRQAGKEAGNAAARTIMQGLRSELPNAVIGMSTYGNVPGWFPLAGWLESCDFAGGQLYTITPEKVQLRLHDWATICDEAGVEHVPNFGAYKWTRVDGRRRARSKSRAELDTHLGAFVSSEVPVKALIGWADNFVQRPQWRSLAKWADWLDRGALSLPPR